MQEPMTILKQSHELADREAFFRQVIDVAPGLEMYVRNRLRTAEHNGLIPPGLYTPQDILDEVFLEVYEHFHEMSPEGESDLRIKLFQMANEKLDEIIRTESWRHSALSLEDILADEIRLLNEIPQMTVDADGDIVMVEDLDDAEMQPREPRALLLEDSFEDEVINQLGLSPAVKGDRAMEQLLARVYAELPPQSRILFDLWTRGKLSVEEIARVRGLSVEQVRAILERISSEFQRFF